MLFYSEKVRTLIYTLHSLAAYKTDGRLTYFLMVAVLELVMDCADLGHSWLNRDP